MPHVRVFEIVGCKFGRDGKGTAGMERTLTKGSGAGGDTGRFTKRKVIPLKDNCERVVSHVWETG